VQEVVGDVLTWWFGTQFWSKCEPKNPTAHYDDLWRQRSGLLTIDPHFRKEPNLRADLTHGDLHLQVVCQGGAHCRC
jgi:hypothetical protein